jgi:ABC-type branched-subunit amino acid transport system ATPase component
MSTAAAAVTVDRGQTIFTSVAGLSRVTLATSSHVVALHDVSLELPRGRVTAVVSPRDGAAGTVADVLVGRYRPRWGEVHRPERLAEVRRRLGRARRGRSAGDELLAHSRGPADAAWVARLADELGLQAVESSSSWQEVDAQRVRWGFAVSLVAQPDLVVADDLSGGYLRAAGHCLLEQLGALVRDSRSAMLVTAGDLAVADAVDHVVVLERGRVVEGPA